MTANTFRKSLFWACATAVLVLSLLRHAEELPTTGWDKSNHFIGFFALALLGLRAYPARGLALFAGLLLFGGLIELLQSFTGFRVAEWGDWSADGVGVVAGFGFYALLRRFGVRP